MLTKNYRESLIGLMITAGVGFVSTALGQNTIAAVTGLASGVAINALLPYGISFLEHFKKHISHPDELNHNLQLIMQESINDALSNVRKKYHPENEDDRLLVKKFTDEIIDNTATFFIPTPGEPKIFLNEVLTETHDKLTSLMTELNRKVRGRGLSDGYTDFFKAHIQTELEFAFTQNLKAPRNAEGWIAFQKIMYEDIKKDTQLILDGQTKLEQELADIKQLNRSRARKLSEHELNVLTQFNRRLADFSEVQPLFNDQLNLLVSRLEQQMNEMNANLVAQRNILTDIAGYLTKERYHYQVAVFTVLLLGFVIAGIILYGRSQPFEAGVVIDIPASSDSWSFGDTVRITLKYGKEFQTIETKSFTPVYFRNIPGKYRNDTARIIVSGLEGEPFRQHCDTCVYMLSTDKPMHVKLDFYHLDSFDGYVRDEDSQEVLSGAIVTIAGISSVTDSLGHFIIKLPSVKQHRFQNITIVRKGYQERTFYRVPPHTSTNSYYSILSKPKA